MPTQHGDRDRGGVSAVRIYLARCQRLSPVLSALACSIHAASPTYLTRHFTPGRFPRKRR